MKKVILGLSIVALFFTSCKEDKSKKTETKEAEEVVKTTSNTDYKVISSKLTWKGYKPTGTHNGTINLKEGELNFEDDNLKGRKFTFDMASIKVLDIKDAKYNADLTGHLANKDFFDVTQFPTGTFEITNVTKEDIITTVEGNLTLKGITKNISFPASVIPQKDGTTVFLSNAIKIDRTEFGIKYKSKKFFDNLKDKFVNDLFDITFEVTIKK